MLSWLSLLFFLSDDLLFLRYILGRSFSDLVNNENSFLLFIIENIFLLSSRELGFSSILFFVILESVELSSTILLSEIIFFEFSIITNSTISLFIKLLSLLELSLDFCSEL